MSCWLYTMRVVSRIRTAPAKWARLLATQEDHASCPDNGVQKMVQRTANQGNAAPNNGKHERGGDGEKATSNLVQIVGEVGLCVPEWEGQLGEREQEDGNE